MAGLKHLESEHGLFLVLQFFPSVLYNADGGPLPKQSWFAGPFVRRGCKIAKAKANGRMVPETGLEVACSALQMVPAWCLTT